MATSYNLYNQMYYKKVMKSDADNELFTLSDPSNDDNTKWVIEPDEDVDGKIGNRIKNVQSDMYLTAEPNNESVTVKPDMKITGNYTNKWFLSRRAQDGNQFNTTIESAANGKFLAYNGVSIVADTKGQMWKFVQTQDAEQVLEYQN